MPRRWASVCAALSLLLVGAAPARAHQRTLAFVSVQVSGRHVTLRLRATPFVLAPLLGEAAGPRPPPALFADQRAAVLRNTAAYLTLQLADGPLCPRRAATLERAEGTLIALRFEYECPRHPEQLELRYDLLFDDDPLHRAIVSAPGELAQPTAVLSSGSRTFRVSRAVSAWQHAESYLRLGVEHIFTGYDHLCFLLGLLLAAAARGDARETGRARLLRLLAIVTAFTVAHSLTLIAAALDLLRLPARLVEPAIALSILYVGLENLLRRAPRWRWALAFGFGLVHGFGFAHILREVGLPQRGLLLSLFAFNGGVELGQLAVAGLLFPWLLLLGRDRPGIREAALGAALLCALAALLRLGGVPVPPAPAAAAVAVLAAALVLAARRFGYRRALLQGGSAIIALLGLLWLVQRVLGA